MCAEEHYAIYITLAIDFNGNEARTNKARNHKSSLQTVTAHSSHTAGKVRLAMPLSSPCAAERIATEAERLPRASEGSSVCTRK